MRTVASPTAMKPTPRSEYHIDYIYIPEAWLADVREVGIGAFEDWCGNRLSDHVVVEVGNGNGTASPD